MAKTFNPKKSLETELGIGDWLLSVDPFHNRFDLSYAGMPSKDAFSIIVIKSHINSKFAYNQFYPMSQKNIRICDTNFKVLSVDAEKIKLKYYGER